MQVYRVYSDGAGESHFDDINLAAMTSWFKGLPASEIKFMTFRAGEFVDWHPPPYPLIVIIVSGSLEVGVTDGEKKILGPGATRLMTDTGKGHTTQAVGDGPATIAVIRLAA